MRKSRASRKVKYRRVKRIVAAYRRIQNEPVECTNPPNEGPNTSNENQGNSLNVIAWLDYLEPRTIESESIETERPVETTVSDALRVWAIKTRPTCSAVGHLLKALRPFHVDLPLDYRTLMRTPRASVWKNVGTGKYIHMGLAKSISALIPHRHNSAEYLHLQLHVDGLTMWNSSRYQLWPILGRILKPFLTTPFVVGVYGGMEKPSDVSEYLSDIILELRDTL